MVVGKIRIKHQNLCSLCLVGDYIKFGALSLNMAESNVAQHFNIYMYTYLYAFPSILIIPVRHTGLPVQCLGISSYKLSAFDHTLGNEITYYNIVIHQLLSFTSPKVRINHNQGD